MMLSHSRGQEGRVPGAEADAQAHLQHQAEQPELQQLWPLTCLDFEQAVQEHLARPPRLATTVPIRVNAAAGFPYRLASEFTSDWAGRASGMNDLPGEITGRRRRFGLKSQLLLLLFGLNIGLTFDLGLLFLGNAVSLGDIRLPA